MAHFFNQKENREIYWHRLLLSVSKSFELRGRIPVSQYASMPVTFFVNGLEQTMRFFAKILHHTQLGQLAINALQYEKVKSAKRYAFFAFSFSSKP